MTYFPRFPQRVFLYSTHGNLTYAYAPRKSPGYTVKRVKDDERRRKDEKTGIDDPLRYIAARSCGSDVRAIGRCKRPALRQARNAGRPLRREQKDHGRSDRDFAGPPRAR